MIRIQLLGTNAGYLDVVEDSIVALTISVADIKDITKRTGSFSKTILLPGTKNNNMLLNDYFEVNVIDGTFSINKVQRCLLLDDNIPLFQNMVLQLISVKKKQGTNMEDDFVEYEISIKDTTADFFTIINNRYLNELDFSAFSHTYSAANIKDSFSHSEVDGYKYIIPFGDDNLYPITELKPAIYAKQYWTKIHADAGFSYVWSSELAQNVRFDKLLIPFSSGEIKIGEDAINASRVIATGAAGQDFISPTTTVQAPYLWRGGDISKLTANTEIQDPLNKYNTGNSRYTSPFFVTQPNCYEYILEFDYDIVVDNLNPTFNAIITNSNNAYYGQLNAVAAVYNRRTLTFEKVFCNASPTNTIKNIIFPPGETVVYSAKAKVMINTSNHQVNDELEVYLGLEHAAGTNSPLAISRICEFKLRLTSDIKVTIQLNSTQLYNTFLDMNQYLPLKVKQSDFIKAIMTMYNLYVEVDPIDPNKLIYTYRDEFYDNGLLVDWTDKLAREDEQQLRFLPELSSKSIVFTYKQDDDPANEGYEDVVNEIYGQHEVIFSNNYVKGTDRKEILFSPTPMQISNWGSVLPLIPSGNQKYNMRIVLDNGNQPCQRWFLINHTDIVTAGFPPTFNFDAYVELSYYPFISHLDSIENPTFDLNFGICDFYFYDIRNITNNNLFNNFWRRTCGQINNGRLLTAYFYLKNADIINLRLNAKIRIDNSYWHINKILDFDVNKNQLTKVELMSIDDELPLPSFGLDSAFYPPGQQLPPINSPVFISNNDIISKSVTQLYNQINHTNRTTNNSNNGVISLGNFNSVDGGVRGVLIGDFIRATESGIYVGQNTFIGTNLGNVGGLPSTLTVDNNTGGNDIVLNTGDRIVSDDGLSFIELDATNDLIYLEVTDGVSRTLNIVMDNPNGTGGLYGFETATNDNAKIELDAQNSGVWLQGFNSSFTGDISISPNTIILQHTDSSNYNNIIDLNSNTTAGINITSQNLLSGILSIASLRDADLTLEHNDTINFARVILEPGKTTINHSDGATYDNSVIVENSASTGILIESNDLVTVDTGSIQVTPTQIVITNPTLLVLNSPLINIPNLPPYADDAAAGAGGLNAGDLYQTDGTGALTTAGIVMIKQ